MRQVEGVLSRGRAGGWGGGGGSIPSRRFRGVQGGALTSHLLAALGGAEAGEGRKPQPRPRRLCCPLPTGSSSLCFFLL